MAVLTITVELFYSAAWHTVPVYTRDAITITRGRANESQRVSPSTATLSIDNRTLAYSPRNPTSALYGVIGRNTPIRITCDSSVRFVGEVESWPQKSNVKGNDVWVPITANGILRRLNAPGTTRPAESALYRAVTRSTTAPFAYWPMESTNSGDTVSTDTLLSPISGVGPMTQAIRGASFGRGEAGPGSGPVPDFTTGGTLAADIPNDGLFVAATGYTVEYIARYDNNADPTIAGPGIRWFTPGAAQPARFETDHGNSGFSLFIGDLGGTIALTLSGGNPAQDGLSHHYRITVIQSGGNVAVAIYVDGVAVDTDTVAGTVNRPASTTVGEGNLGEPFDDLAKGIGHLTFWHGVSPPADTVTAAAAHVGETAGARIVRLCLEDDITLGIVGDLDETHTMGVQRVAPFLDLLYDCEDTDGGILYESRSQLNLTYRCHADLYNQSPALDLDYDAGGEVAPPLDPVEDTDATGNDITVTRFQGSSAHVVQDTGPMNVQEPTADPEGVGRYRRDFTLVLESDDQCESQASWKRHLGTWDEARFPVINLDLTAMSVAGKSALIIAAKAFDIGQRLSIASPPSWLPPDDIEQHAQGFTETLEPAHWTIAVNATPALPYEVLELESTSRNRGRIPTGGSTLAGTMTTTSTSRTVNSANVRWIDSATYATQFPFDIMVAGEQMTVTAITGTSSPQTFTVTRSVNGVVKTQASGADVQLLNPPVIAL